MFVAYSETENGNETLSSFSSFSYTTHWLHESMNSCILGCEACKTQRPTLINQQVFQDVKVLIDIAKCPTQKPKTKAGRKSQSATDSSGGKRSRIYTFFNHSYSYRALHNISKAWISWQMRHTSWVKPAQYKYQQIWGFPCAHIEHAAKTELRQVLQWRIIQCKAMKIWSYITK